MGIKTLRCPQWTCGSGPSLFVLNNGPKSYIEPGAKEKKPGRVGALSGQQRGRHVRPEPDCSSGLKPGVSTVPACKAGGRRLRVSPARGLVGGSPSPCRARSWGVKSSGQPGPGLTRACCLPPLSWGRRGCRLSLPLAWLGLLHAGCPCPASLQNPRRVCGTCWTLGGGLKGAQSLSSGAPISGCTWQPLHPVGKKRKSPVL